MGYVEDNLLPREKILFAARVHPAIFLPSILSFLFAVIFLIYGFKTNGFVPIIFAIFFLLYSLKLAFEASIIMLTTEFAVTNRRIIAKTGFIRRHSLEILLPQVESIAVKQNILGRLLNFGTVTVIGTGGTRESFKAIADPINVRRKINKVLEAYMRYRQRLSYR